MLTLEQARSTAGRMEQLEAALYELIRAGEDFLYGEGSRVEVDLDYCEALADLEEAIEQGRCVFPRPAECDPVAWDETHNTGPPAGEARPQ